MGKATHTPGPWKSRDWRVVDSQGENGMCTTVICDTGNNAKTRTTENKANARLIAAAPELLETLHALVEQFHAYENGWMGEGIWRTRIGLPDDLKRAEAAIKKAKGE